MHQSGNWSHTQASWLNSCTNRHSIFEKVTSSKRVSHGYEWDLIWSSSHSLPLSHTHTRTNTLASHTQHSTAHAHTHTHRPELCGSQSRVKWEPLESPQDALNAKAANHLLMRLFQFTPKLNTHNKTQAGDYLIQYSVDNKFSIGFSSCFDTKITWNTHIHTHGADESHIPNGISIPKCFICLLHMDWLDREPKVRISE